jgi:hypothetical protein
MKETLEELAEKYSINEFPLKDFEGTQWNNQRENCKGDFLAGAKAGAKWQQEQDKNKYSEEDMVQFSEWVTIMYPNQRKLLTTSDKRGFYSTKELLIKWFEQFKKK